MESNFKINPKEKKIKKINNNFYSLSREQEKLLELSKKIESENVMHYYAGSN